MLFKYYVDFTGVKNWFEFYRALIKGLDLPAWCGMNLDAIWDMLTGHMGSPGIIYVKGVITMSAHPYDIWCKVLKVINEATEWDGPDGGYEVVILGEGEDFDVVIEEETFERKEYHIYFAGVKTKSDFFRAVIDGFDARNKCGTSPYEICEYIKDNISCPAMVCMYGLEELTAEHSQDWDSLVHFLYTVSDWNKDKGGVELELWD